MDREVINFKEAIIHGKIIRKASNATPVAWPAGTRSWRPRRRRLWNGRRNRCGTRQTFSGNSLYEQTTKLCEEYEVVRLFAGVSPIEAER
ncbi:hypothetical protein EVAR_82439_1 [Eumeta japonica]|uniref:Uncharacterized protein n=1 Tax=Eumeta variegata TaxID=151549 RepID=A0A4C1YF75_EUMVA|nr:hypothetical protein EVAR_82439_1 [Eumeta japonica]